MQAGSSQGVFRDSTQSWVLLAGQQTPFLPFGAVSVARNSCMERLVEQEAPQLLVRPNQSQTTTGTQQAVPKNLYCHGTAQLFPVLGSGHQLSWFASRMWLWLVPCLSSVAPSTMQHRTE